MSVSMAAKQIVCDGMDVVLAGGVDSISLVQNPQMNMSRAADPRVLERAPAVYMAMIDTAEVVSKRYDISREAQDEYSYRSQQLTALAQKNGKLDDEIVPVTVTKLLHDKATGESHKEEITLERDECNRPNTTLEGLAKLPPAFNPDGGTVTAGNASQLSDGASATLVMSSERAKQLGIEPMGIFRGFQVAGCRPEEMGIGPVFAVPKLLKQTGKSLDDIDVVELNEAFASQLLYCQRELGIPDEKLNPIGGSISIGHPYGMTGSRMTGQLLRHLARTGGRFGIVTMCVGGGMGAAGLFEAAS